MRDLLLSFTRIGFVSFGGAAAQIALMHRVVVEEKRWLDEREFSRALSYCMLLPGPEAQQLATYIGYRRHGVAGGVASGVLFVLPGALIMLALSMLFVGGADVAVIEGLFFGLKAAVLAIIVQAVRKFAARSLTNPAAWAIAIMAFVLVGPLPLGFPVVIALSLAAGAILKLGAGAAEEPPAVAVDWRRTGLTALGCLAAWWAPILAVVLALGPGHILSELGLFFSQLAMLTFGGAYAVLAWLSDAAVQRGWVSTAEMMAGLSLAETTPGPTILVNQFIGFLAAFREAAPLSPLAAAALGSLIVTWATFAPSFLWIFAGAPFVERLTRAPRIGGAMAGVTAAVTGVLAWLALVFALNVAFGAFSYASFGPFRLPVVDPAGLDLPAIALAALGFVMIFALKRGMIETILAVAGLGVALVASGLVAP
jgi:chromate transporter